MTMRHKVLLGLIALLALCTTRCSTTQEYFSSIDSMYTLHFIESELIQMYRNYLTEQQRDLALYRNFLENVKERHAAALEDVEEYLGNPMNAFALIKRSVEDWQLLYGLIKSNPRRQTLNQTMFDFHNDWPLPNPYEMRGAAKGLGRLQIIYDLSAIDLSEGIIDEWQYETRLSLRDCFEVGANLFELKEYNLAIKWFEVVLAMIDALNGDNEEVDYFDEKPDEIADTEDESEDSGDGESKEKFKEMPPGEEDECDEDVCVAIADEAVSLNADYGECGGEGMDLGMDYDYGNPYEALLKDVAREKEAGLMMVQDSAGEIIFDESKVYEQLMREASDPNAGTGVEYIDMSQFVDEETPAEEKSEDQLIGEKGENQMKKEENTKKSEQKESKKDDKKAKKREGESEETGEEEDEYEDEEEEDEDEAPKAQTKEAPREKVKETIEAEDEYEDYDAEETEDTPQSQPVKPTEEANNEDGEIEDTDEADYEYEDDEDDQATKTQPQKVLTDTLEYLAIAHYELRQISNATAYLDQLLTIAPDHKIRGMDVYMSLKGPTHKIVLDALDSLKNYQWYSNYTRLCRGIQVPDPSRHQLNCRWETKNNPVFFLAPLKAEELNKDPQVMVYHNVLSETHIANIIEEAEEYMHRSQVKNGTGSVVRDVRVSQQAWLAYESPSMKMVQRMVTDINGYDMRNAESMQMANYGIGGQYDPHPDYFGQGYVPTDWIGDRIQTNMIYLSEVEQGGHTVFTGLNVYSKPVKGSMVSWHNLHKSLVPDPRTIHAGCPVIKGTKRIGNIWIHSGYQEFRRPCELVDDSYKSAGYS